jgi:hypothetical protein
MKSSLKLAIRVVALAVVYFVCFAFVSGALLQPANPQPSPDQAAAALAALVVISLLNALVLSYVILRSRWSGWKLIVAIFFVFYGVVTVMSQVETAFFVTSLPPGMLPRLFLAGAIIAALFAPLAVLILGKARTKTFGFDNYSSLDMTLRQWIPKLLLIAVAYVVIYFTFGYFIAWKSAAVRSYYGGSDPGNFLVQVAGAIRDRPLLLPLQIVRALMWTALAVPVIRMMKGSWWEAGLAVSLLFSVVMCSQLLLPNPFMPEEVRMVHLLETATSNFLFGWLIVFILRVPRRSASQLAYLS